MEDRLIEFDMKKTKPSIIMVAGVGGAGGNAVNHMYDMGIKDVTFMVCNTDKQALDSSFASLKVQLGEGLGAGNNPEKGREAAIESLDEICNMFKNEGTRMVFVTAGMGGGTGTGAAPIIAKAAKDMGILTVAIVTTPYISEGPKRVKNASEGVKELRKHVDSLLIINNENIQEIYGELPLTEAFGRANDVLATAAKGIAEVITRPGIVNVDFADVLTVMKDSEVALMGSSRSEGDNRAIKVAEDALSSPLLNHNTLEGATNILLNIGYGENEITLAESKQILDHIQLQAGKTANIIWGAGKNLSLGDEVELIIIATGFTLDESGNTIAKAGASGGRVGNLDSWNSPDDPFANFGGKIRGPVAEKVFNNPKVIRLKKNKRYENIEKIYNTPAYIRRNVNIYRKPSDGKSSRVKLDGQKKESPEEENRQQSSLFETK